MKLKLTFLILATVFASIIALPAARADQRDQATQFTFSQSVQIPGQVLPAGTYWFVRLDSEFNSNIIRIFNSDRTALRATVQSIPTERRNPTGTTTITFADQGSMPATIVSWFYPGETTGREFLYSKQQERELAKAKEYTIMASADHIIQPRPAGD